MVLGYAVPNKIIAAFNHDSAVMDLGARYLKIVLAGYIFTGITFVYSFSLRSIGNTVQPMLISIIALVTNAFFNYMLIFGKFGAPVMGVEGAALATLIARVFETTALVLSVYLRKGALAASIRELTDVTFEFVKKSYRTIFPVILNDACWGLASLVYSAVYGRMGTQAFASVQICNTVGDLFMVAVFGMSGAAAVMVGNSIGAGDEKLGSDYARSFCILSIVMGIALGLLLVVASPYILNFFNVSMEVRGYVQTILYTISVIFSIRVLDIIIIVGTMRGGGDAKRAFIIEGSTMWFVGVPLTILGAFVFGLPVYIVYGLSIVEEIAKCILGLIRLRSGKWINNVTHSITMTEA
jgi:putative MATE family efflux protein